MRYLKRIMPLNKAGDTIVEVMIVLAVLGSAISISYATANRSLLNARQAQESSEATALAQGQVELLRSMSANPLSDPVHYIFQGGNNSVAYFCINAAGEVVPFTATDLYDSSTFVFADPAKSSDCMLGSSRYNVSIKYDSTSNDKFTVKVIWDDVLGQGEDSSTLIYRVHQDL